MTPGEQYRFGPFHLDVAERELSRDGEVIALTAKTFDLLLILVQGAGRTFERSELLKSLWPRAVVEESNLSQTIFLLRKALGENSDGSDYILTVPRRGYKFIGSVSRQHLGEDRSAASRAPATPARWLWPFIAAVAVLAASWVTVLRVRQPQPLDLSAYRYRPFAYTLGNESAGRWSPDGKSIAFLQGQAARHLMLQPSDGDRAIQLVERVSGDASDIAWSPDATRIYFAKSDGIYSISSAGGQPELVLAGVTYFDLSPDGKAVAVWRTTKSPEGRVRSSVWISSPPGSEPREYKPAPFAAPGANAPVFLRFSPNGKLLYLSMRSYSPRTFAAVVEIWVLPFPASTGPPRHIFGNVPWAVQAAASWMPDSRRLVLSASIAPAAIVALWLADTRDESLTKLTDGSDRREDPAVSADGRRLLFTRVEEHSDIVDLPLDGSPPRKLLATGTSEYSPAWSPKGGEFAYLTQRNGSDELWLRSAQGDWERPIVTTREFPALVFLTAPAISPDGSRIAYNVLLQHQLSGVYVSSAAGGTPTWIERGRAPTWSPDGAAIAFLWLKPGGALVLATVRVGYRQQPFEIPNVACVRSLPVWSPSGEWIACGAAEGTILASPDGNTRRTLPGLDSIALAWSKDSRTLYGLHGENGNWSLVAEGVDSGAIRKVADYGSEITPYTRLNPYNLPLSLSPDGKSLAIGTLRRHTDLWILEGFPK